MATSGKGGYDCEFSTAPPKSLECPICLLTVCQPRVISCCGNQFCQACIGRIQQDNKPCPLCNEVNFTTFLHKGVMREVNSLMIYCPNKKDGCDWKGELGQLEEHLNPSVESNTGKECGYVLVECRYKCGEMFLRNAIRDHENERCSKRPMEVQVVSLAKKLESLSSKLDAVIAENTELKAENQKRKREYEDLRVENIEMKKRIDGVQSVNVSIKSSVMPVPPFFFTLYNVSWHMNNPCEYRQLSRPFYSSSEGYKLRVSVYPNGFGSGNRTHLSFFLGLLLGEYDDKLVWPLTKRFSVEVYNESRKRWVRIREDLDFTEASPTSKNRPAADSVTTEWGYSQFLSHKELKQSYICSNSVRFKISNSN